MFLVTAARLRRLARAQSLRILRAIIYAAVAVLLDIVSGADDSVFRSLAALLRLLARALIRVFGAISTAVAVVVGLESGAEDMAAAILSLVARASIRVVLAIVVAVAGLRLGIESGADYFVYRKGASGPEGASAAGERGERGEREGGEGGDLHDAENSRLRK